jgi:putative nucleotidyltransferase with HDIG domain
MAIPDGLLEGLQRLAPLPVTAQKLIVATSGREVDLDQLTEIIQLDQAAASNLLRVANSPLYAESASPKTLREAVGLLGSETMLDILLDDHLRTLQVSAPLYALSETELWLHGATASLAAVEILREVGRDDVSGFAATAALLHDIGKLIMVRYLKADVSELRDRCREENLTFVEAERCAFGCDHAEVGAAVARKWHFPEVITEAIERHHQAPLEKPTPVTDVVALANLVAKTIGVGLGAEGLNLDIDPASHTRMDLHFNSFCRVCARTASKLPALKQAYGIKG